MINFFSESAYDIGRLLKVGKDRVEIVDCSNCQYCRENDEKTAAALEASNSAASVPLATQSPVTQPDVAGNSTLFIQRNNLVNYADMCSSDSDSDDLVISSANISLPYPSPGPSTATDTPSSQRSERFSSSPKRRRSTDVDEYTNPPRESFSMDPSPSMFEKSQPLSKTPCMEMEPPPPPFNMSDLKTSSYTWSDDSEDSDSTVFLDPDGSRAEEVEMTKERRRGGRNWKYERYPSSDSSETKRTKKRSRWGSPEMDDLIGRSTTSASGDKVIEDIMSNLKKLEKQKREEFLKESQAQSQKEIIVSISDHGRTVHRSVKNTNNDFDMFCIPNVPNPSNTSTYLRHNTTSDMLSSQVPELPPTRELNKPTTTPFLSFADIHKSFQNQRQTLGIFDDDDCQSEVSSVTGRNIPDETLESLVYGSIFKSRCLTCYESGHSDKDCKYSEEVRTDPRLRDLMLARRSRFFEQNPELRKAAVKAKKSFQAGSDSQNRRHHFN